MEKFTNWRRHFNSNGTSLQGYLSGISHKEITQLLGMGEGPSDKTKDEWCVKNNLNGVIATIYDWKNYNKELSEVTHWNIGGHTQDALILIKKLFPKASVTKF